MHIAMIAAENGALIGGKVGGIGDVIRDVPLALAALGHQVSVLTPGYGVLARQNPAVLLGTVTVNFCGHPEVLEVFKVEARASTPSAAKRGKTGKAAGVTHYVLEHPLFSACGAGSIYCNDHYGPFATDAHKFALYCVAVCELLRTHKLGVVDVLHLHDWHAALLAILRRYATAYQALRNIPVVYTIHNLSLQGVHNARSTGTHRQHLTDPAWLVAARHQEQVPGTIERVRQLLREATQIQKIFMPCHDRGEEMFISLVSTADHDENAIPQLLQQSLQGADWSGRSALVGRHRFAQQSALLSRDTANGGQRDCHRATTTPPLCQAQLRIEMRSRDLLLVAHPAQQTALDEIQQLCSRAPRRGSMLIIAAIENADQPPGGVQLLQIPFQTFATDEAMRQICRNQNLSGIAR